MTTSTTQINPGHPSSLQNNQNRWAQFFQSQGRAMPQVQRPLPALPQPQTNPVAGSPLPAQSNWAQRNPQPGGLLGGLLSMAQQQQAARAAQPTPPAQPSAGQGPLGRNFFRSRSFQ